MYMVEGQKPWSRFMAAKWVEPESNQPSRVLVSWEKCLPPQWGQTKPSGRISHAGRSNQALEPSFSKSWATASMLSSVQTGFLQSSQ